MTYGLVAVSVVVTLLLLNVTYKSLRRAVPTLPSGALRLPELDDGTEWFTKGAWVRLLSRVAGPPLLIGALLASMPPLGDMVTAGAADLLAYGLGSAGMVLYFRRRDAAFIEARPEFEGCEVPSRLRNLSAGFYVVFTSLLAVSILLIPAYGPMTALAIIPFLFVWRRILLASIQRHQKPIDFESSLGQKLKQVFDQMGVSLTSIIELPHTGLNAFALTNGSVLITRPAKLFLTEDEIVGVLVHELSHLKHRDAKTYSWLQLAPALAALACLLATTLVVKRIWFHPDRLQLAAVLSICCYVKVVLDAACARVRHRIEFRADGYSKNLGYGEAFGEALMKITRYNRLPSRWPATDRWFLTHPDLANRLRRLGPAQG
jgi:Zn-dependent protease with chaperone function